MESDRLQQALARIEAGFARIEDAAGNIRAADSVTRDNALMRENRTLREAIGAALREIDRLIGRLEG